MKTMLKILSLAAILAASAPVALADNINGSIDLSGAGHFTASTDTFTATSGAGSVTSATGTPFLDFFTGAPSVTIVFDNFTTSEATGLPIFSIKLTSGPNAGETLSFTESSFGAVTAADPAEGEGASVDITGIIADTGTATTTYTPVAGTLDFSENGFNVSFTEDSLVTGGGKLSSAPEPGGLVLLGTGLLTAVGVARRKLKV
jgi:hypothetical protein